jgi:uncharacterized membrane protein/glutaredoxin
MRRPAPWIHRFSRPLIGAIAALGVAVTAYLTSVKLSGGGVLCSSQDCNIVLSSPYANFFGFPLSLFGLLAYLAMVVLAILPFAINAKSHKKLHNQAQELTWLGLLLGGSSMMVFSGYLMYLLAFQIKVACPYCVASACFATIIFLLVLIGKEWEEISAVVMNVIIAGFLTMGVTLFAYSTVAPAISSETPTTENIQVLSPTTNGEVGTGWTVLSKSGASELSLAEHLQKSGAKMYGAWSCSHCFEQKQLFGREAVKASLPYVECAEKGKNSQVELCKKEGIEGYPTWSINGKKYPGVQSPEKLAELSGYSGSKNFLYSKLMPEQLKAK